MSNSENTLSKKTIAIIVIIAILIIAAISAVVVFLKDKGQTSAMAEDNPQSVAEQENTEQEQKDSQQPAEQSVTSETPSTDSSQMPTDVASADSTGTTSGTATGTDNTGTTPSSTGTTSNIPTTGSTTPKTTSNNSSNTGTANSSSVSSGTANNNPNNIPESVIEETQTVYSEDHKKVEEGEILSWTPTSLAVTSVAANLNKLQLYAPNLETTKTSIVLDKNGKPKDENVTDVALYERVQYTITIRNTGNAAGTVKAGITYDSLPEGFDYNESLDKYAFSAKIIKADGTEINNAINFLSDVEFDEESRIAKLNKDIDLYAGDTLTIQYSLKVKSNFLDDVTIENSVASKPIEKNSITVNGSTPVKDDKEHNAKKEFVDVTATKVWDDANYTGKRPTKVTLQVKNGNDVVASQEVTSANAIADAENKWTYTFTNLPKYDENGNEINYTIAEVLSNEDNSKYYEQESINQQNREITNVSKYGKVTVHYYIMNTDGTTTTNKVPDVNGNPIEDVVIEGREGTPYTSEVANNVNNKYELIESATVGQTTGTINKYDENNPQEVIYYYKLKDTSVLVHHYIDGTTTQVPSKNGGEVADETINGKVDDTYSTKPSANISDKYELVEEKKPANANGTMTFEQIVVTYYYKLKDTSVLVHHYIDGTTTQVPSKNGGVVADETIKGKVDDSYSTYPSSNIADNYEVVDVTPANANGTMTIDQIVVTYYYKLKDPSIEQSIDKESELEKVTEKDQEIPYTITYTANVKEYIGDAEVVIVDTLPYAIDEEKSDLNGGTYNSGNHTITWTENITGINSFTNTNNSISITKDISLVYINLDLKQANVSNNVTGTINLKTPEKTDTPVEDTEEIPIEFLKVSIDKTVTGIIHSTTPNVTDSVTSEDEDKKDEKEKVHTYNNLNASLNDTIIYDIKVLNEGNTQLTDVTVTDDKDVTIRGVTPITDGVVGTEETLDTPIPTNNGDNLLLKVKNENKLTPGEGYIFKVSYTLGLADLADKTEVSNTAEVTSNENTSDNSTSTVTTTATFEHELTKEIISVGEDNDLSTSSEKAEFVKPDDSVNIENTTPVVNKYTDEAYKGETIRYKITAINNGTTTIDNLVLKDFKDVKVESIKFSNEDEAHTFADNNMVQKGNNLLAFDGVKNTLAPGEKVEIIVAYTITDSTSESTLDIVNTAELIGEARDPKPDEPNTSYKPVHDYAQAIIKAKMQADISIEKSSNKINTVLQPGDKIQYTVTLTNSSPVKGTAYVTEGAPDGTTLYGNIQITTSEGEDTVLNPNIEEDKAKIEQMASKDGLELTVPGKEGEKDGTVVITFTVEVQNSAIGTTVTNQAEFKQDNNTEPEKSNSITNQVNKDINIYESNTKYGKQSVVIVVDMTLSMAADATNGNSDRLAYCPVTTDENGNKTFNYEAGYHNTRWYQLKQQLDKFIKEYFETDKSGKREVAIVGFYKNAVVSGDFNKFYTNASDAMKVYANVFTQEQYTAAVKFADYCYKNDGEKEFESFFDNYYNGTSKTPYKTTFGTNEKGEYNIDVDLLEGLEDFCAAEGNAEKLGLSDSKIGDCQLSSGTYLKKGLDAAYELVKDKKDDESLANVVIITDGVDNSKNSNDEINSSAEKIMQNTVNGEKSKLYAIGFTSDADSDDNDDFKFKEGVNCTDYESAGNSSALEGALNAIITQNPTEDTSPATLTTINNDINWNGWIDFSESDKVNGILEKRINKITIYTTDVNNPIATYDSFDDLDNDNYYDKPNKKFNLKQFILDKGIKPSDEINMQIDTSE